MLDGHLRVFTGMPDKGSWATAMHSLNGRERVLNILLHQAAYAPAQMARKS